MGSVYRALHLRFGEIRALKVLSPQLAADALFARRFEQEAVLTRKLQHPNAVRVEDIDESEDGQPFIVMEYIQGRSLRELIDSEAPLDPARVCSLAIQIASALGAAHALGIVHRDIKPENIAVHSEGAEKVKVLDFGIAKVKEDLASSVSISLTQTGMAIGTPAYMSPEQALGKRGEELDGRSDIYSLGVVMYECLTGKKPIAGDTPMQVLIGQIHSPPIPILEVRGRLAIPSGIAALVMRCLEKDPALRPATAAELAAALEQCGAEANPMARAAAAQAQGEQPEAIGSRGRRRGVRPCASKPPSGSGPMACLTRRCERWTNAPARTPTGGHRTKRAHRSRTSEIDTNAPAASKACFVRRGSTSRRAAPSMPRHFCERAWSATLRTSAYGHCCSRRNRGWRRRRPSTHVTLSACRTRTRGRHCSRTRDSETDRNS